MPRTRHHPIVGERLELVRAVPGLRLKIRRIICSTNAVESLESRCRRPIRAGGHFPTEQAAMKSPLLHDPFSGPHRPRLGAMGNQVEAA